MNAEVTQNDLFELLSALKRSSFEAGLCEEDERVAYISKKCESLFKLDYSIIEFDNTAGNLCPKYPSRIYIPEAETHHTNGTTTTGVTTNGCNGTNGGHHPYVSFANGFGQKEVIYEDLYDTGKVRELITMAKYARCRQRFVVPVMMYKGKYICRSATVSVMPETYGRKVVDFAYDVFSGVSGNAETEQGNNDEEAEPDVSPFSYCEVIKSDIQLLKCLKVGTIIDLMVENRKTKFLLTVSSSEKADPENQYEGFNLVSLPYPGCEFFKDFRDNNYIARDLYFDWNQSFIDATIKIPRRSPLYDLDAKWEEYMRWDLVQMTQNYLKAALKCIQDENSGLLIHCISGWDRTPLFISLVRLSLWADGLIHQSLNELQISYLTLAYDWYLFGHQLPDRLKRGEDILFFCFHVLKYITDDEFSVVDPPQHRKRTKTTSSSGSNTSSVVVIRPESIEDEESRDPDDLDYLLANMDQDSNDSFSNNSFCDINTTASSTTTTPEPTPVCNTLTTSRPPFTRRTETSPISVPGAVAKEKQRQDATCATSSSVSSWMLVSETGSIDSIRSSSLMMKPSCNKNECCSNGHVSSSAESWKQNPESWKQNTESCVQCPNANGITPPVETIRKARLSQIRATVIQAYGKTVGLDFQEGGSLALSSLVATMF